MKADFIRQSSLGYLEKQGGWILGWLDIALDIGLDIGGILAAGYWRKLHFARRVGLGGVRVEQLSSIVTGRALLGVSMEGISATLFNRFRRALPGELRIVFDVSSRRNEQGDSF